MSSGKGAARTGQQAGPASSPQARMVQFVTAATARPDPGVDARIQQLLNSQAQWALLDRLTGFDRQHHLRVHDLLVLGGHQDPDLLRAALLHDVGKADERGRVMLAHRVGRVVGNAIAPSLLGRIARPGGSMLTHGLYLAEHHAGIGAELARRAGASSRCCDLIARHEDRDFGGDQHLSALAAADAEAFR